MVDDDETSAEVASKWCKKCHKPWLTNHRSVCTPIDCDGSCSYTYCEAKKKRKNKKKEKCQAKGFVGVSPTLEDKAKNLQSPELFKQYYDETIKRTLDRYSQVGDKRLIDCISPNEESSAKKRQVSVEPENEEQEHDNEERDNEEQESDEQASDCESGGWNDEELVAIVNQAKQSFSAADEHDLLLKIDKRTKNMEKQMSSLRAALIDLLKTIKKK